ncbi:MAG: class I SAM-dependent methyltransferase [Spirulinaceae cyanobacterium SM2_1_0]|nr:class I SAM-dependent methyltransferase [Spirulinaceae cyanobacterium SM2_1_0]
MSNHNQSVYTAPGIVRHYQQLKQLQPAEQVILERFRDTLPQLKMLDIGVGGGRTTQHFARLAQEYVGIDYSAAMIAACQRRFPHAALSVSLEIGDARTLTRFADNHFDFILFSFNGLDYVSHGDRQQILQTIHRVSKPGGYFYFSSHNLQGIASTFDYRQQLRLNPLNTYVNLVMTTLLWLCNPTLSHQKLSTAEYAIVRDESHNFRLQTYYIRPTAQLQQLEPYFTDTEVYAWQTGRRLTADELTTNTDLWLYYLCRVK